jgi:nonsense-mediated mRNA decay protein 3
MLMERIFQIKLTVQGEVIGGAVLQQIFIVEYLIAHQMCDDCHRTEAKDYWRALVSNSQNLFIFVLL